MKQKTFYSLLLAGVITFTSGVLESCTEDEAEMFTTQRIVINYTDSVVDASISPDAKTRSQSVCSTPAGGVLTSKSGKKLYLSCTETLLPSDKTMKTRGTKVATAGISNLGVSASVYPAASSYTSAGCGSYFYKESVSSGTPMSYYWPTTDYRISFFGYYPYNNAAFTVLSAASATGVPTYAYTVPSTIASQQDIMTGQATDHPGGSSSPVNMTLAHRCSAIHFSVTNDRSEAITVNSISIEGVKYSGTLNENTWTLGSGVNSSSTNPFTLSSNASVAADATVDITGTSNVFMMLPQSLPATAKLKVVVDDEEFEIELTGIWTAGKEYNYNIAMSEGCIDLSMVDNAGNARLTMTTANCYLVHAAGKYKIPLVYGNAIKNGVSNTIAYNPGGENTSTYCANFVNHNDDPITGPWITKNGSGVDAGMNLTVASAELLWQDARGLISAVGITGDYLTFAVGTFTRGNALIAVKDGSGTILWSWHIWATEDDLSNTTVVSTGSHDYTVAPVNLGWVPTRTSGNNQCSLYYQWGRKDPFISAAPELYTRNKDVYNISGTSVDGINYSNTGVTIADNIKNPTTHYLYSSNTGPVTTTYYNMWDAQNTTTNNVTTATKKTIYDPCPPGFCVPTGNLYCYMGDGLSNPTSYTMRNDSNWDSTNKGKTWTLNGANIYFPAVGFRNYNSGALSSVGTYGYYWSATPSSTNNSCYLNPGNRYWTWTSTVRALSFSVRPVAEE